MNSLSHTHEISSSERAIACFQGVAVGDIIGRAGGWHTTESILSSYGHLIQDIVVRQPNALKPKSKWLLGQTSDDTVFTLAVARSILKHRFVCRRSICYELRGIPEKYFSAASGMWKVKESNNLDYFHLEGAHSGAAMRASPMGIIWNIKQVDDLVNSVINMSVMTHGDSTAISAACAVAAAISAAIEGCVGQRVIDHAAKASIICERQISNSNLPNVSDKLLEVYSLIENVSVNLLNPNNMLDFRDLIAKSCDISRRACFLVPVAIALAVKFGNARQVIIAATNLGGDTDTRASIAGAIAAAIAPRTLPSPWILTMEDVNKHQMELLASELFRLRGKLKTYDCTHWEDKQPVANDMCMCLNYDKTIEYSNLT